VRGGEQGDQSERPEAGSSGLGGAAHAVSVAASPGEKRGGRTCVRMRGPRRWPVRAHPGQRRHLFQAKRE
jgi:hypothetical protein